MRITRRGSSETLVFENRRLSLTGIRRAALEPKSAWYSQIGFGLDRGVDREPQRRVVVDLKRRILVAQWAVTGVNQPASVVTYGSYRPGSTSTM